MVQNGLKWFKIVQNGPEPFRMVQLDWLTLFVEAFDEFVDVSSNQELCDKKDVVCVLRGLHQVEDEGAVAGLQCLVPQTR